MGDIQILKPDWLIQSVNIESGEGRFTSMQLQVVTPYHNDYISREEAEKLVQAMENATREFFNGKTDWKIKNLNQNTIKVISIDSAKRKI